MTSCTILNSQLINKPRLYYPNLRDNHHSLQRSDYFAKHISPLQASLPRRKNSKLEERSKTNLPSLTEFRPTTKAEGLTAILAKIYNSEFCQICLVKNKQTRIHKYFLWRRQPTYIFKACKSLKISRNEHPISDSIMVTAFISASTPWWCNYTHCLWKMGTSMKKLAAVQPREHRSCSGRKQETFQEVN